MFVPYGSRAQRHYCRLAMAFTSLDSIGSDVGKRPMGFTIATSESRTEY